MIRLFKWRPRGVRGGGPLHYRGAHEINRDIREGELLRGLRF